MRDFFLILPEIFIALTLAFVIFGEITYHGERVRLISVTAILGLSSAVVQSVIVYAAGPAQAFSGALSIDGLTFFFRLLFLVLGIFSVVMLLHSKEIDLRKRAEAIALVLAGTLGMSVAGAAVEFPLIFGAIFFVNTVNYFLTAQAKRSVLSSEAGIKLMILSGVAVIFLLYGAGVIFNGTGLLNLFEIHKALRTQALDPVVALIGFVLLMVSLMFQTGMFPMHFWVPDVLEGAPTPISSVLSAGGRLVGFAVLIRVLFSVFSYPEQVPGQWAVLGAVDWPNILAFVSGVTMLLGSLLAVRQDGAKRMLGGVVLSQSGMLLIGILVLSWKGIIAVLYNLTIEVFALVGCFYVLSFYVNQKQSDRLDRLRGVLRTAPVETIMLILFAFSLVGVPPFPGFFGKFTLMDAALDHGWPLLGMIAIVSMVISVVSLGRLFYSLCGDFRMDAPAEISVDRDRHVFLFSIFLPLLLLGIFAQPVLVWATKSIEFILW